MFFAVYLTMIALVMSGVVVGLYLHQQGEASAALVSPVEVLDLRDNLTLFEMNEQELIFGSLESASGSFGSEEFRASFRSNFLSGATDEMKDFLLEDLYYSGKRFVLTSDSERESFFENVVYSDVGLKYENGELVFVRGKIGKIGILKGGGNDDVRFDVDYVFEFDRKYFIKKVGDDFVVEVDE